jgi:hypothetical protein
VGRAGAEGRQVIAVEDPGWVAARGILAEEDWQVILLAILVALAGED